MEQIVKNAKPRIDCNRCGKPLTREDRVGGRFAVSRFNDKGELLEDYIFRTLYEASRLTEVSLCALINAAEKGNPKETRIKDGATFYIVWNRIHETC